MHARTGDNKNKKTFFFRYTVRGARSAKTVFFTFNCDILDYHLYLQQTVRTRLYNCLLFTVVFLFSYKLYYRIHHAAAITTMPYQTIKQFYEGKNIFLTGVTGFVGVCYIEKILRTIPDVGNIFVLLRPRKGLGVQERLTALKKNSVSCPIIVKRL